MKRAIRSAAIMALGAFWLGVSAYGQVTTATIYGNMLDPSGAAVAQAAVVATNELTNAGFNATSDERGEFTLTFLPVGRYTISIKAPGFKEQKPTGLELSAGQRLSFRLHAGGWRSHRKRDGDRRGKSAKHGGRRTAGRDHRTTNKGAATFEARLDQSREYRNWGFGRDRTVRSL